MGNLKPGGIFGPKIERKSVEARKSLNISIHDEATSCNEGEKVETIPVKSTLGLPMADASDAWMDDVGEGGFSESDDEEIISGTYLPSMQIEDNNNEIAEVKFLPITESSEAWMDEVVG